jgi:hypothetical protein
MWRHSPALLPTGRAGQWLPALAILLDVDDRAHVRWCARLAGWCGGPRCVGAVDRLAADVVGAPVDVVDPRCRIIIGTDERTRLRRDHCGG